MPLPLTARQIPLNQIPSKKLSFDLSDFIQGAEITKVDEYEKQKERIRQEKLYEYYKTCGVPSKFFETSLATYITETDEEKKNLEKMKKVLDSEKVVWYYIKAVREAAVYLVN